MRRIAALVIAVATLVAACGGGDDEGGAAQSSAISTGKGLYQSTCAVCHGDAGEGGVGRALDAVVADFPDCADQVRWITLGSSGWESEVGPTFGTSQIPVSGGMPAYAPTFSDEEIRAVTAYTRVRFGGQAESDALADCGA
jgi:mono/diheme cytochrome c family protein